MVFLRVLCLVLLVGTMVYADVYFHMCRGSNNRLNGQNRERQTDNRLFDSQNNDRGGYNVGGDGSRVAEPMKYMVGSTVSLEWTNQHQCGGDNTHCMIVLQYMCDEHLRDGISTSRISESLTSNNVRYGQHENQTYYAQCKTRRRNGGLYHAAQKLDGYSAEYTRQNPNGNRNGLECPEERDYYPYWGPTPWKDIAIFTSNISKCPEYKLESQNVKAKGYCKYKSDRTFSQNAARANNNGKVDEDKLAPNTQEECDRRSDEFIWVIVPAHGIPEPACEEAPKSRDNHLGNTNTQGAGSDGIPQTLSYSWVVPNDIASSCTLRIRYNISVGDYHPFETISYHDAPDGDQGAGSIPIALENGIPIDEAVSRGYYMQDNPNIYPLKTNGVAEENLVLQLAINTAQTGRVFEDRCHRFSIVARSSNIPPTVNITNLNVRGKRGNIVQVYPAVEYDFVPNHMEVPKDGYVNIQWTGSNRNPNNNDGEGTQGTDRSNIILLASRKFPPNSQPSNVYGWPGSSYPQPLNAGTFMNLPKSLAERLALPTDDGKRDQASLNNGDEHEDKDDSYSLIMDEANAMIEDIEDEEGELEKYDVIVKDPSARPSRRRRRRRRRSTRDDDVALLNRAPYYVNLGAQKAETCGTYHYMCTRNNNFSNRSQKGKCTVNCPTK